MAGIYGAKQHEVAPYLTLPSPLFGLDVNGYVMNAAKLNGMPPDLRTIVLDAATKANARANAACSRLYTHFASEIGKSTGDAPVHIDPANYREPLDNLMKQAQSKFSASDPVVKALIKARSTQK